MSAFGLLGVAAVIAGLTAVSGVDTAIAMADSTDARRNRFVADLYLDAAATPAGDCRVLAGQLRSVVAGGGGVALPVVRIRLFEPPTECPEGFLVDTGRFCLLRLRLGWRRPGGTVFYAAVEVAAVSEWTVAAGSAEARPSPLVLANGFTTHG